MKATRFSLLSCAAVLTIGVTPAIAQSTDSGQAAAPRAPQVDVTPFVSLGSDFSSRVGASIAFRLSDGFSAEVEVGYRRAEIDALRGTANLLYRLPRIRRVQPYVAAGLGLEQYGVPLTIPTFGVITQQRVGMSSSLGGGLRVPVTARWDYRGDVRWLNPWGSTPEGWRVYNGVSVQVGKR